MTDYRLTTQKSWRETLFDLEETMRLWGVTQWEVNYPRGARTNVWQQPEADRTVKLTFTKNGKPITFEMGKQYRAVDNLRVLYLAVESMRMNEKRGMSDVVESGYLQLAAPAPVQDPYEVLEIRPNASLDIAEAAYKAKVRKIHPDAGGSHEQMKVLNQAIEQIRRQSKEDHPMAKDHMTPQQKRELGTHLTALVGISRTHPGQVTDKVEAIKTYVNTMVNAAYQQGKEDMRDEMEEQLPL